ncbi:MAG: hypothetical protein PHQ40_21745, partial [Anaerolineaceae bacterium]|nr:hypothetical protein [Anaerolineaceae bacterium]
MLRLMNRRFLQSKYTLLFGILLLAALIKAGLVIAGSVPFNADEAVVGLMAKHILAGERPVFFYGQAYMGSLDAYLIAAGFALFGEQVWVIRLVQGLLFIATLFTTYWLGEVAFKSTRTGLLAVTLLAIPAVNVTLYTTATLGGYGEALLIGNCTLLAVLRVAKIVTNDDNTFTTETAPPWIWICLVGFLSGFGLWTNGLTLVYSLPAGVLLAWCMLTQPWLNSARRIFKTLLIYLSGFLLGSLPWWIYAIQHGFGALLGELLGGAVAVEGGTYLSRTGLHLLNFAVLGLPAILGLRPPWEVRWLALPLAPLALAFWIGSFVVAARQVTRPGEKRFGYWLWWGVILSLVLGFLGTTFGVDPSGRYFLPIAIAMAFFGAELLAKLLVRQKGVAILLLIGILSFNLTGTLQSALANPPGLSTQFNPETLIDQRYTVELATFLESNGETRGY